MGRKGPRAKTKTVLKPVKQWEKHGSMPKSKFLTFLKKESPYQHNAPDEDPFEATVCVDIWVLSIGCFFGTGSHVYGV